MSLFYQTRVVLSLRPIATDHANPTIRKIQDGRDWLSNYSPV